MAGTKRTWLTVVVAAVVVVFMVCIAAVGGIAYFVYSHMETEFVDAAPADAKIAESRRRFAGQQPLIDIRQGHEPIVRRADPTPQQTSTSLQAMHAIVYDPSARKMVDVTIPFWLLRMAPESSNWSILSDNGVEVDSERIRLTVADLERLGPRLIIDHQGRDGQQVLVWTQ
jgi:uncharacterized membrane protein